MQLPNHPAPRQQIITTAPGTDSAQNSNTQHKHLGTKFHSYEKQKPTVIKAGGMSFVENPRWNGASIAFEHTTHLVVLKVSGVVP